MKKKWFYDSQGRGSCTEILRIMKLTFLFISFSYIGVSASTFLQHGKYTLCMKDAKLEAVLHELQEHIGENLFYSLKDISNNISVSVDIRDASLEELLDACLKNSGLGYKLKHETVILYKLKDNENKTSNSQQEEKEDKKVSGTVLDEQGLPMAGVTILVHGVNRGVVTDANGKYSISVPAKDSHLYFSFIGFESQTIDTKGKSTINVQMTPRSEEVQEVVVTGIFNKAKESFTGAATLITKKELAEFKSNNLLKTIANVDPSFNIIQNNDLGSDPNKLPEINIRGTTSIPSNIEDLQAGERANLNTPLFILDGFEISLERMMDLDPEEIESVTLLKDASSTAIYGSRGSNGVVVLTSVKPKAGKLTVRIASNTNLEIPDLSSYDLLNAREKLEIERIAGFYQGESLAQELELRDLYSEKLQAVEEGVNTYWLDKPLQTGVSQNYRLSLGGGDPAFRYSLSASYNNTVAVMKGSYRDNFNGSLNISYIKDKISFTNIASIGINSSSESKYGNFKQYCELNPYWEMYDDKGEMIKVFGKYDIVTGKVDNPLYASQVDMRDERTYTSIRNNTSMEWKPYKTIKVGLRAGISQQISETNYFKPPTHVDFEEVDDIKQKGLYNYGISKSHNWSVSLRTSYAKVFNFHSIFVGIDGNLSENRSVNYGMSVQGFTHDRLDFISMGSQYVGDVPTGSESKGRSIGLTGNVNYNYRQMLYVDGSYRLDGASSFGEHGRFKPYYSIGVGWTVSRLKFFQDNLSSISSLRFRYNYGVTGSLQFSSPYQALTIYQYNLSKRYNGELGAVIKGYGNPDLSWQYTYSHNLGMDLSLFKGKMSLNINVYRKTTEGMTTSMNLPLSHGYSSYTENKGDVENQGMDANVSIRLIRKRHVTWSMRAGIAHNENKILRLSEAMKQMSKMAEEAGREDPNYLYREGESMNALYVVPSLGIDPNTGKEIFITQRGEPTYTWQPENRKSYGVREPKVNGRFSSSIRWKGVSATASFGVRLGGQLYNSTLISKVESADVRRNVDRRVFTERWQKPGDQAKYKALDATGGAQQSSRFVQDESTLQLNSLNINYNFPKKLLKPLRLKGANFSASLMDLFYISTVKRERGTSFPFSNKMNFSLSVTL